MRFRKLPTFFFSRFHQSLTVFHILSKHTKHHNLHGEVGNFSHHPMRIIRDPECQNGPKSHPEIRRQRCFTLFYVSSGDFGLRF